MTSHPALLQGFPRLEEECQRVGMLIWGSRQQARHIQSVLHQKFIKAKGFFFFFNILFFFLMKQLR